MSTTFMVAISAGVICGIVVAAYFIAIDQSKAVTATNGAWAPPPVRTTWLKQLELLARPLASRMPAHATGPLRQKLSRAGDPGNLTPAGFQAVRYGVAALFAVAGLTIGLLLRLPVPSLLLVPASGALAAFVGYFAPSLWLNQRISQRRRQIERSLAEATDLLTLVVESGMSLDEGLLSITERFHNALGDEIGKVLREIRLGRPRMAALEHMAESTEWPTCITWSSQSSSRTRWASRSLGCCGSRRWRCDGASARPPRSGRHPLHPAWSSRWWAASSPSCGSCSSARPSSKS